MREELQSNNSAAEVTAIKCKDISIAHLEHDRDNALAENELLRAEARILQKGRDGVIEEAAVDELLKQCREVYAKAKTAAAQAQGAKLDRLMQG